MSCTVLIAHAEGEEAVAEKLAAPLRQTGYEVVHQDTVLVGESFTEQASRILAAGSPLIVCATVRALGTGWAHRLVNAAKPFNATRVFVVQIEKDAYTDQIAAGSAVAAYWRNPSAAIADLVSALQKYFPSSSGQTQAAIGGFDLVQYRDGLRIRYSHLKLESLETSGVDHGPLLLLRIFVEQNVRACQQLNPRAYELPKEYQRRLKEKGAMEREIRELEIEQLRQSYFQQSTRPVLEVLANPVQRLFTILGDPGSGKSVLLQYFALHWARLPDLEIATHAVPLLIELKTYVENLGRGQCCNFLEYFDHGAGVYGHLDQHELDAALRRGNGILLLDGLDEIFDLGMRQAVVNDIVRLTTEYPHARFVLTSRVIGYQHQTLRDAGFQHYMLQDLDRAQIQTFIQRWHDLAYLDPEDRKTKRERLEKAIDESLAIRELAENPLLLTMMALLNRHQELPRDRTELYEQASRLLLQQWDASRALQDNKLLVGKSFDYKDKQAMLRAVAFRMQTYPKGLAGNVISTEDLKYILVEYLRDQRYEAPRDVAQQLIQQLRERNFILCFLGDDYYAFVHRTFLEFFCAWAFVWKFEKDQTLKLEDLQRETFDAHWQDEIWHEVLRLITGRVEASFAGRFIRSLLEKADPSHKQTHVFLAAQCLAAVRNRGAMHSLNSLLEGKLRDLTRFDLPFYYERWEGFVEIADEVRAKAVHALVSISSQPLTTRIWLLSCAGADQNSAVRQAAVQELARGWKDAPDTLLWLKQLAGADQDSDVRRVAVQELARGWKDAPDTLLWLKQLAGADQNSDVRQAAMQELARGWKDDPETLPIVKQLAGADQNSAVRWVAVQVLARGWKDNPETLPIVKQLAGADQNWAVRWVAMQELARGWKDDPETLPIVKQLAGADPDSNVRQAAMRELARGWKDDPETLPIVKQLAGADQNSAVRQVAVEELARGWKDAPDTLLWLKQLAGTDPDSNVRQAAMQELARGWKDDPETLPIVKQLAGADQNSDVRRVAVEELARGWKDAPDTLLWLKQLAGTDPDSDVRQAAMQELARGWKDDPETLPIVKQLAGADLDSDVRRAAVRELARGWKDDPETLPIVKQLAGADLDSDVRRAAVRELARGWKDDPETLPIVKQLAGADQNSAVRQAAMQELARGWKDAPDTLLWLKQLAGADQDWAVRQAAVGELARGWKDDPETLPIFKQLAGADQNSAVRWVAVQELARGWKDDPETLPIFKQLAGADPDSNVRRAAMQELARGWKDDPETLPIVKQLAGADPDSDVRQAAVQELARGWKDDPEILSVLKQRAASDEDADVRYAAVQELARGWKEDPETSSWLKQLNY